MKLRYLIANALLALAFFLTIATAAYADGFTTTAQPINYQRPLTCYVKGYGAGEFVQHRVTTAGVVIDGLGANSLGIGAQVGCDLSNDRFLVGLFTDYTWNKASVNINAGAPILSVPLSNEFSVGGRLGVWAKPGVLMYGLAAYNVAQERAMMVGLPIGLGGPKGYTVGLGTEIDLGRGILWTLEYRHTSFDTNTATLLPMTFDTTNNSVRTGIGYRF